MLVQLHGLRDQEFEVVFPAEINIEDYRASLLGRYQPVGSRTLSRDSGLDLSPATIRNIMSDLEELGFVDSPHTSAGRIPTIKGYRFFVDTLIKLTPPNGDDLLRFAHGLNQSAYRER